MKKKRIPQFLFVIVILMLCSPFSDAFSTGQNVVESTDLEQSNDLPNLSSLSYSTNNPYYNSGYGGQCTAFAWGRSQEKMGISLEFNTKSYPSAKYWWIYGPVSSLNLKTGQVVQSNSIAVWGGDTSNPNGHVAYVERVENGMVYFNEANVDTYVKTDWGGGYDGYLKSKTVSEFTNREKGIGSILGLKQA